MEQKNAIGTEFRKIINEVVLDNISRAMNSLYNDLQGLDDNLMITEIEGLTLYAENIIRDCLEYQKDCLIDLKFKQVRNISQRKERSED